VSKSDEQVLVIPTAVLRQAGMFQGLCRDVDRYLPIILDPAAFSFLPRSRAEDDPSFKQLIPYVVLMCKGQVFHYTRGQGGGEKRLRALRSVGIGGHINPDDQLPSPSGRGVGGEGDAEHPYRQGLARELAEEVTIETAYRETCLGFINDDSTPVGAVHLGIVHLFELDEPKAQRREADLMNVGFALIVDLVRAKNEFETWSQFVLDELSQSE
jgi:predicted NUDIX family phosphoesterase